METRSNALLVGAVVIVLSLGLLLSIAWIGKGSWIGNQHYYTIYFDSAVTGLLDGSSVNYQGVPIGKVDEITLEIEPKDRVKVRVALNKQVVIKEGTVASLQMQGLTGGKIIRLQAPQVSAPPLIAPKGEPYPVIQSEASFLDNIVERIPSILDQIATVAKRISSFITPENQERFSNILEHLEISAKETPALLEQIQRLAAKGESSFEKADRVLQAWQEAGEHVKGAAHPLKTWLTNNKRYLDHLVKEGSLHLEKVLKDSGKLIGKWNHLTDQLQENTLRFIQGKHIPEYPMEP